MGIRLLLGEEHAYAIVVTAQARKKFELRPRRPSCAAKCCRCETSCALLLPIPAAPGGALRHGRGSVGRRVKRFGAGPRANGRVPTLLWSLDGVMRYLPMAALYDGHRYMVERFNNVLFTPESYGHMTIAAGANSAGLRVLAMGLSKSLWRSAAASRCDAGTGCRGPRSCGAGIAWPHGRKAAVQRTVHLAALKTELGAGNSFPVVHIASHFVEEMGSGDEPYLMLGGENAGTAEGYALTLSRMEDSTISFHGTRLLTLSACSTAKGDVAKDGLEMDSLGMIAQQKDAEAVLATLWDVNDASTSRLMSDFYARWVKDPSSGKAEALRQAQLAFLQAPDASSTAGGGRGVEVVQESTPAAHDMGYSHPFYWAPFVLIGNYH